ncbi:MAG: amidohydrolase [Pseudomonadota bacterium]
MKKFLLSLLTVLIIIAVSLWLWITPEKPPEYQAFVDGRVLTMNQINQVAEAVLLENDRILAVGTNSEIRKLMPTNTWVHNLDGRTLMPGIIDAHGHFPGSGFFAVGANLNSPPIGMVKSLSELVKLMNEQAANTAIGEWVVGMGYDDTQLLEHRHPTRAELDAITTEHPLFVLHISGHMGVGNSKAMEIMGIDANTPNPAGGVIVKDANGELTGLLEETAMMPMFTAATDFGTGEVLKIVQRAVADYISKGVTTAQNGAADRKTINGMYYASRLNLVPLRLEVWPLYSDMSEAILSGEFEANDFRSDRFRIGALKIIADGSIQGYTGFLREPYHVQPSKSHGEANASDDADSGSNGGYVGYPTLSQEELTELVREHFAIGTRLAIHGNGDAAIDYILNAVASAQADYPNDDARTIIIHSQMARPDQLDRMHELGVTPSFFSAHTYYWGDRHRDIFMGPERAARMSPARTAGEKGVPYTIHLDTPVVPMDPMLLVWSAVNRESTSGKTIGAYEQISAMQALRATTIDAAWQIFREDEIGSIEVGKLADLVILDGNPLGAKDKIRDIQVDQTFIGGVSVYTRTQ